ncbi:hypothetical protein MKX01_027211 [Papaver californicum]|nr:hypothetical protein MKX01_027211 [Papaver californicum]
MGKNDFLTPKAIANRIKAKGLQKLRWYCQMCQKQCRDENGFKCHCMSESHQRQMEVFGQNPTRVIDGYTEEFEITFLDHLKRSHRFSRIAAIVVYNEYIVDRHHVHMNSTEWATLTDFVKHLGSTGKCKVEETPKGWFMTYIDRDSETLFKERLKNKRVKTIRRQIERAEQLILLSTIEEGQEGDEAEKLLVPKLEGRKIAFALGSSFKPAAEGNCESSTSKVVLSEFETDKAEKKGKGSGALSKGGGEKAKERNNRKDYWLCEGIIVKVMSKDLAQKGYYKQKAQVVKVIDKYVGELQMLDSKHILRVDQEELETVIPQIGGLVKIVNGAYRGSKARLLKVDTDKFSAKVQIKKGICDGRVLQNTIYK